MAGDKITHPSVEAVRCVADVFERSVQLWPEGKVSMMEGSVDCRHHDCGTTHCHAGWYVATKMTECPDAKIIRDLKEQDRTIDYSDGVDLITADLGFKTPTDLLSWANEYPEIWGNGAGYLMFNSVTAFGLPSAQLTRQYIAQHWMVVADRLQKLESGNS